MTPFNTVLIIEDEPDSRESLRMLLEALGYRAESAADAATGLEILRSRGAEVVLCDLGLPEGPSGVVFAMEVRGDPRLKNLPLIAFTGYADRKHRHQAKRAGFDAVLVKPANSKEIVAAFAKVAKRRGPARRHTMEYVDGVAHRSGLAPGNDAREA